MNLAESNSLLTRIQARLAASRFFTFSLLLHVIVVVMAGSVIVVRQITTEPPVFESGGEWIDADAVVSVTPPVHEKPPETSVADAVAPPVVTPPLGVLVTHSNGPTAFVLPNFGGVNGDRMLEAAVPATVPLSPDLLSRPTGMFPPHMTTRLPGERAGAARKMGGKDKAERAVMSGLRWLKEHQNTDGSWSDEFRPSMTGLALLCFLGHGELPESPEFGPTVKRAVDWLLENGIRNQGRLSMADAFTQPGVYEHGIATYALGEYFSMTKDDRVRDLLTQAVRYIVDGQAPDGGWQYAFAKGPESDTSVSGWQIQALKAAHLTGLAIPGVDAALDHSLVNLRRVRGPQGGFGYRKPEDRYSLTGVGVLCMLFWQGEKNDAIRDGIRFLLEKTEEDFPVRYASDKADLYAWYYHTQACLMFGGSAWTKWNRWFQDEIADHQSADGSWPPTGNPKAHGPETKPGGAGPVYRTTLCVLMLEVFYRYMPTSK